MALSTFMQFGSESEIAAKDVGQPKFRLIDGTTDEPLYVLLGSLHMPSESDALVAQAEAHVNQTALRTLLINTLARCAQRRIGAGGYFQYVRRAPHVKDGGPAIRRMAHP